MLTVMAGTVEATTWRCPGHRVGGMASKFALLAVMTAMARTVVARTTWKCPCDYGCSVSCPCMCACPCADDPTLCYPMDPAPNVHDRELWAFHAHLYNETGRSAAANFDHYPWANLTTVAVYTGEGDHLS